MGGGDLHVGLAIGHLLAELVVHAAGDEFGEGADEGDLARHGQAGRRAHHVGFGDAALDETFGEFGGEGIHLEGALEVCGEGDDPFVGPSGLQQARTETAAGVLFTCVDVFFHGLSLLKVT